MIDALCRQEGLQAASAEGVFKQGKCGGSSPGWGRGPGGLWQPLIVSQGSQGMGPLRKQMCEAVCVDKHGKEGKSLAGGRMA